MNRINRWMAGALTLGCVSCVLASGCTAATGGPGDTGASEPVAGNTAADTTVYTAEPAAADGGRAATGLTGVIRRGHGQLGPM
jgi:hypothetical protein